MKKKKRKKRSVIRDWFKSLIIALIMIIFFKTFIIESYIVTTTHMQKTLYSGDYLFINKFRYGARLPITLLSVPFFSSYYLDWIQIPYSRLPGFSEPARNELILYNYPMEDDHPVDKKNRFVKRCIGIPGDTIEIKNKEVFINMQWLPSPHTAQFHYRIITNGVSLSEEWLKKYAVTEGGIVSDIGVYDFFMDSATAAALSREPYIRNVRKLQKVRGYDSHMYFPDDRYSLWNSDFFGPLVVPRQGMQIDIHYKNIEIYRRIIETYEKNKLTVEDKKIYINDTEVSHYLFRNNYYFVVDDNRDNSKDSRFWGFVPESYIIGKASLVWFSINRKGNGSGSVRWERIFTILK